MAVSREEALGSNLRIVRDMMRRVVSLGPKVSPLVWDDAQSYSVLPGINVERLDSDRVTPHITPYGMGMLCKVVLLPSLIRSLGNVAKSDLPLSTRFTGGHDPWAWPPDPAVLDSC